MSKITFIGAGSTVFAKIVLGDCMQTPALQGFELALFDIDLQRLKDSENMLNHLKLSSGSTCVVKAYTNRKEALKGAKYVINAIQVGGYDPCTITDFEIPKSMGCARQSPIRWESVGFSVTCGRFRRCWTLRPISAKCARMPCS